MSAVREGSIASNGLSDGAMVLVPLFSLGTPGATLPVVAPSVMPGTDYMDARAQFLFRLSGATRPAAVASADSAMTVWTTRVGEFTYSAFETFCENGPCEGPTFDSGCASSDVRAGTIARDDGFLLAFSSGRDWGTCLLDDGIPGPPTRIQTERRGGPPGVAPGADIVMPEPIAELTMVQRRPEGGWVVVRTDGSTSFQPPPIVGIPVDDAGFAASQPVVLVPEGATVGPIAASAFGDGLAVAWVAASPDPVAPDIGVRVFDRDGNLLAETSLSTSAAFLSPNERLSLIESPSHDALLLGWSSAGAEPKVVAARVACR
ncbi:MAG: hypothetical protein HOW73_46985 [Polyangiaceae bacterium]|nr:hypothetical protein [Polyangiaceae bacterium]